MTRKRTQRCLLALAVLGTVGFGYLAVHDVHFGEIWTALRNSNYWWALPSVALTAVAVLIRAQRWRLLFRAERRPPFPLITRALLISYFFNNILPARMGEVARIIYLKRRAGISRSETSATVVLERLFDVLSLCLLLLVLFPWLPPITWLRSVGVLAALVAGGLVVAVGLLALFEDRPVRFALRPLVRFRLSPARADAVADSIGQGLAAIRDVKIASTALVCTTVSWLVAAASAWVLMFGFELDLSFTAAIVVVVAVNLSQVLPSLPSGLGVVEAATVLALNAYGVDGSLALAYALVYHALNFVPFVAAGPFVLGRGRSWRLAQPDHA